MIEQDRLFKNKLPFLYFSLFRVIIITIDRLLRQVRLLVLKQKGVSDELSLMNINVE